MTASATLLATLAGILIPVIADVLKGWISGQQDAAALVQKGADQSTAAANKESADATDRMSAANAQPRSRTSAAERMRDGTA